MSSVLAGPPSACCARTVHHIGEARGTVEKIGELNTYVSRPPKAEDANKVIIYFSDVFGPMYINSKLIMDYWAEHGFLVLGVDYLDGDSWLDKIGTEGPGFENLRVWVERLNKHAGEVTPPWCEAVKKQFGGPNAKFFCVGYCFGAPFVCDLLAQDWVTAGAFAHPSILTEAQFRNIKKPLLLSCAENDFTFPLESRRRAEDILRETKTPYMFQVFGQVDHGFATRADPNVPAQRWAKEEAARATVDWFIHHASAA